MPLQSIQFRDDPRLQRCLVDDAAHVTPGTVGDFVTKIQQALMMLGAGSIERAEIAGKRYGASTAATVLRYKQQRNIVNRSYQSQADNIVGKMTIASLDADMLNLERRQVTVVEKSFCRIRPHPQRQA